MDAGRTGGTAGPDRPGGYASWVAWIDDFRRGDDRGLETLPPIDGRMGTYVEARLLDRLSTAFSERVRSWQSALGRRIVAAPPSDEAQVAALLRDALPALEPLARVAASSRLPRPLAAAMHELLAGTRAGARDAVRESARRLREPELQPRLQRTARPTPPVTPPVTAPVTPTAAATPVVPAPRDPGALGSVRPAYAPQRVR
ncbi:hypothetical protein [Actinomycetospora sp. NBRC 106378]|uniref:hypothetical protein n=1 Tax=Actinomycetospora sp. NBRC 106378 TaxID=3032208 RepID=UPI0024A47574|nr:hypothetical protein [Actinomycetospora sp. NBRC 106378]GLZ50515.1 hypothetical protein Acsp07_01320 [Actinomycetospora sp. NBRC 106378]